MRLLRLIAALALPVRSHKPVPKSFISPQHCQSFATDVTSPHAPGRNRRRREAKGV